MGIAFTGLFYFNIGNEIERFFLLIHILRVRVSFHDLDLVSLTFMSTVGCIRIGRILE